MRETWRKMRAFAFFMLTGGLLATAAAPVFAAQIVETFTISVSGDADQHFMNSPFDLFDPSLGTLTGVAESVTGSLTWDFGDDPGKRSCLRGGNGREPDFHLRREGSQVIAVRLNRAGNCGLSNRRVPGLREAALELAAGVCFGKHGFELGGRLHSE
jgi:hypothetical protein